MVVQNVLKSMESKSGILIMLALIYLAGFFVIFLFGTFMFFFSREDLFDLMFNYRALFKSDVVTIFISNIACLSVGMASYLASHIFFGFPAAILQVLYYKCRPMEAAEIFNIYTENTRKKAHGLHWAKDALFFIASYRINGGSRDVRFLFSQLMFSRSCLLAFNLIVVYLSSIPMLLPLYAAVILYIFTVFAYTFGTIVFSRVVVVSYLACHNPSIR